MSDRIFCVCIQHILRVSDAAGVDEDFAFFLGEAEKLASCSASAPTMTIESSNASSRGLAVETYLSVDAMGGYFL